MKSRSAGPVLLIWLTSVLLLWGLAFLPVPEETPEWILTAQVVCFGSAPGGFPEAYGWLNLIGSPAMMLVAILFIWSPKVILDTIKNAVQSKSSIAIIAIFAILSGRIIYSVVRKVQTAVQLENIVYAVNPEKLPLDFPEENKVLPSFKLTEHQNIKAFITNKDIQGPALLTFAYSHCETICPMIVQSSVQAALAYNKTNDGDQSPDTTNLKTKLKNNFKNKKAKVYIITLDPWRDKPGHLPQIAANWKLPAIAHLMTSKNPEKVNRVLDKLNVDRSRDEQTGEIIHPALIYVIDQQSKIRYALINPGVNRIVDALSKTEKPAKTTKVKQTKDIVAENE